MLRRSWVAFLCLLAACARRNQPQPTVARPLPATGLVSADLTGRWRITEVETLEHHARGVTNPEDERETLGGLVSRTPGAVLTIAQGELISVGDVVLRRSPPRDEFTTLHINQVNDRFVVYANHSDTSRMADGGVSMLEAVLGTVDRNHLLGMVYYTGGGGFGSPLGTITHHLARVVLAREP